MHPGARTQAPSRAEQMGPSPGAGTCSQPPPWLVSDGLPAGRGGCPFSANDRLRRQVMEYPGGLASCRVRPGTIVWTSLTGLGRGGGRNGRRKAPCVRVLACVLACVCVCVCVCVSWSLFSLLPAAFPSFLLSLSVFCSVSSPRELKLERSLHSFICFNKDSIFKQHICSN